MENEVKMPTEKQRLEIYRRVRAYLKENFMAGFCKGFYNVSRQKDLKRKMFNSTEGVVRPGFRFDAHDNGRLRMIYPEIAKRKPKTWYDNSNYWFDPYGNRKANSPRIRILTEAIKELGGE